MRIHQDWSRLDDYPAAAALVGPFPHRVFLEAWWDERGTGDLMLVEGDGALLALMRRPDGVVSFLGESDLTDYHAPLGSDVRSLIVHLAGELGPGAPFVLDSMPEEATVAISDGLAAAGATFEIREHEVAAVVDLNGPRDTWLASLSSKERHEVRRKRRRFEEALGVPRLTRDNSQDGRERFAEFHRLAAGEKGSFMTADMERLFAVLIERAGAVLDLLVAGDRVVAAAVGFEEDDAYYLYNSAYDPEVSAASPGVVLVDLLIGSAAAAGRSRFDFLKGDERYKFRMGAYRRPLFVVEGAT